jgi:large subunit ribosomal protein L11
VTKTPPATFFLKMAARIQKGSAEPNKAPSGTIKRSQLRDIAEVKMKDLNANDLDAAAKIIEGSARAMGLNVVEG